jgi:hypothetical protein
VIDGEKADLVRELVGKHVSHSWASTLDPDTVSGSRWSAIARCPLCDWSYSRRLVTKGRCQNDAVIVKDKLRRHMRKDHTLGEIQDFLLTKAMEQ